MKITLEVEVREVPDMEEPGPTATKQWVLEQIMHKLGEWGNRKNSMQRVGFNIYDVRTDDIEPPTPQPSQPVALPPPSPGPTPLQIESD